MDENSLHDRISYTESAFLIIYFSLLAACLFSPIASNIYLPKIPDFANYLIGVIQAKFALDQGQFPVITAPTIYQGLHYPYFQFSSPLAYLISGGIYKWITPSNPFIAFKLTIWGMCVFAAFYIYKLIIELMNSKGIAILAATLYLFSPYLIININARGDLPECLAIGIIPFIIYKNIQCLKKTDLSNLLFCAIGWFALALIHIITFIYSSLFIGLFLICFNIQERLPLKNLFFLGIAYVIGLLLSSWYLFPIILNSHYLYTHYALANPFYFKWVSPLATLLSPSAVSPMPLPGNGKLPSPFYVGIGWPMLIGVGIVAYQYFIKRKIADYIPPLLFLFFIVFFIICVPVNFWKFLPKELHVLQFGFRLLIQIMWIGVILFAYALTIVLERISFKQVALGILLIGIANNSWFQTNLSSERTVADIVKLPEFKEWGWGAKSFVISPLLYPYENSDLVKIKNMKRLPILFYPNMLEIKVNGRRVNYFPTPMHEVNKKEIIELNPMMTQVEVSPGVNHIEAKFVGLKWANKISLVAWIFVLLSLLPLRRPATCSRDPVESEKGRG